MAGEGVIAVDRAVALLAAFRRGEEAASLAQLSARTGLHKTTILRLAASLERAGLLTRMPDGGFRLGGRLLAFAAIYRSSLPLDRAVRPHLVTLARETGESASLYVREGRSRVCVARIEAERSVRVAVYEGSSAALDDTATGLVLRGLNGDPSDGSHSFAPVFTTGVTDPETASMSVPLLAAEGEIVGALTISGPAFRFTAAEAARAAPILSRAAADCSTALGGGAEDTAPEGKPTRKGRSAAARQPAENGQRRLARSRRVA